MSGVNKAILVGRLGKDPEVRHLENGATVANFSIATSETYKDKNTGERKELTEWHNIVLWRGLADVAEKYLKKGDMVYIEGKLKTRSWDKDGITRYTTEVVGDNMTMIGGTPNSGSGNGGAMNEGGQSRQEPQYTESHATQPANQQPTDVTDDLPF
ncbi:MAG: single-stranded DNA-binding protein [Cyclobacteriaceae bacterium]